jgi:hypothetical protein
VIDDPGTDESACSDDRDLHGSIIDEIGQRGNKV